MTSQAERIKAFKLAQHARLRKQDDEEQWISSEELCTEGSSDEETVTNIASHRKLKRNSKIQKRGISPLAQPPKKETSTSFHHESRYLLPDLPVSPEVTEINDQLRLNTLKSKEECNLPELESYESKDSNKSSDSEESIDSSEIEKMIQWRPKRGSIKLPDFAEGIPVEVTSVDSV